MNHKQEILSQFFKERDVKKLCKTFFKTVQAAQHLTPSQEEIVRKVAFGESRRLNISAFTRYGKTQCVALGVGLFILFNKNKKIVFLAPQREQAEILRDYMSELIIACSLLAEMAELEGGGIERLRREASKRRQTFKNGCEYRILSAFGEAKQVMGHGGNMVIIDEAGLISNEAYMKITRMLGDDAENSILIELYNPWTRDSIAYKHAISENFETIRIPWQIGIKEGRITKDFVDERREEMSPLAFTILYDSKFPEESEDQLISYAHIKKAVNKWGQFTKIDQTIIGCDVADKGMDRTVIMLARKQENKYRIESIYSEPKSENTAVAGRIIDMQQKFNAQLVNVDAIGVGVGVVSMLKEKKPHHLVKINPCHYGEAAIKKDKFVNKKAEQYWRLRSLFEEGMISIPDEQKLIDELISMRWEHSSSGKVKIIDPDKSPDFADALVYTCWQTMTNKWTYHVA